MRRTGGCGREPGADQGRSAGLVEKADRPRAAVPCIYYGMEQQFDGHGDDDRYIREAMFGGEFGALETRHRHFFNEDHPVYRELSKILRIRRHHIAMRRGRQYLREISGDGRNFGVPTMIGGVIRSIVPWSRIFDEREVLLAVNTDFFNPREAWVTIDEGLHATKSTLTCLYSSDANQIDSKTTVEARNGKAVWITAPPAGVVIYAE